MNKSLSLAHLKRTRLRNCYLKNDPNRIDFIMLNNVITVSLLKNTKSKTKQKTKTKKIIMQT